MAAAPRKADYHPPDHTAESSKSPHDDHRLYRQRSSSSTAAVVGSQIARPVPIHTPSTSSLNPPSFLTVDSSWDPRYRRPSAASSSLSLSSATSRRPSRSAQSDRTTSPPTSPLPASQSSRRSILRGARSAVEASHDETYRALSRNRQGSHSSRPASIFSQEEADFARPHSPAGRPGSISEAPRSPRPSPSVGHLNGAAGLGVVPAPRRSSKSSTASKGERIPASLSSVAAMAGLEESEASSSSPSLSRASRERAVSSSSTSSTRLLKTPKKLKKRFASPVPAVPTMEDHSAFLKSATAMMRDASASSTALSVHSTTSMSEAEVQPRTPGKARFRDIFAGLKKSSKQVVPAESSSSSPLPSSPLPTLPSPNEGRHATVNGTKGASDSSSKDLLSVPGHIKANTDQDRIRETSQDTYLGEVRSDGHSPSSSLYYSPEGAIQPQRPSSTLDSLLTPLNAESSSTSLASSAALPDARAKAVPSNSATKAVAAPPLPVARTSKTVIANASSDRAPGPQGLHLERAESISAPDSAQVKPSETEPKLLDQEVLARRVPPSSTRRVRSHRSDSAPVFTPTSSRPSSRIVSSKISPSTPELDERIQPSPSSLRIVTSLDRSNSAGRVRREATLPASPRSPNRKSRRRRKESSQRPLSIDSVSSTGSWKLLLPRSSSLLPYEGIRPAGETGPFPTPPPRSSSSSQQGYFWNGGEDPDSIPGTAATSPSQRSGFAVHASMNGDTESISNKVDTKPSSSVALLASRFGGATKTSLQRSTVPPKESHRAKNQEDPQSEKSMDDQPPTVSPHHGFTDAKGAEQWRQVADAKPFTLEAVQPACDRTGSTSSEYEDATQSLTLGSPTLDRPSASPAAKSSNSPRVQPREAPLARPQTASSAHTTAALSSSHGSELATANPVRPARNPMRAPPVAKDAVAGQRELSVTADAASSKAVPVPPIAPSSVSRDECLASEAMDAKLLGSSPLRSSIEAAARMGGALSLTASSLDKISDVHKGGGDSGMRESAGNALPEQLAAPLELSGDSRYGQRAHQDVEDRGDEFEEEDAEDEEAAGLATDPHSVVGTPNKPFRVNRLRKATPPTLASAFRPRKASAGSKDTENGSATVRNKRWPFSSRDHGSEGEEEDRETRSVRSPMTSIRRKKDVKVRPQIRRVFDDPLNEAGSEVESTAPDHAPLSEEAPRQPRLNQQQSLSSLRSAAMSMDGSQNANGSTADGRGSQDALPSPSISIKSSLQSKATGANGLYRSQSPTVSWTKGELDPQTRRILKRRNVIRELVHTERSYAADLAIIRDVYLSNARAKAGVALNSPAGTSWGANGSLTPSHSPLISQASSLFLPYRNPSAAASFNRSQRSPSGDILLGFPQPAVGQLHRKVSSPAIVNHSNGLDSRAQALPSPSLSTTMSDSNRSSIATSASVFPSSKTDSMLSESAVLSAVKDGKLGITAETEARLQQSGQIAPSTPPSMTVTASTSNTSTFDGAHAHMASLISRNGNSTPQKNGEDGRERPAVSVDTNTTPSCGSGVAGLPGSSAGTPVLSALPDAPFTPSEIRIIFAGVELCSAFSEEMLGLLESAMGTLAANGLPSTATELADQEDDFIGAVFLQLTNRIQQVYGIYYAKHEASIAKLQEVATTSAKASSFLRECIAAVRGHTNAWDLASLLIKPVQRMLKYPLLLQQILATTSSSHPDHHSLSIAIEEMQKVADSINELSRRKEIITRIIGGKAGGGGSPISATGSGANGGAGRSRSGSKLVSSKTIRLGKLGRDKTPAANLAASTPNVLERPQYAHFTERLRILQRGVDTLGIHSVQWSASVRTSIGSQINLLKAWQNVYQLSRDESADQFGGPGDDEIQKMIQVLRESVDPRWRILDGSIRREILPVLDKVKRIFDGPLAIMDRRDEREEDYLKYRAALARNDKVTDRKLIDSANGFVALHLQLVDELPAFLFGVESILDTVVATLARLQSKYLGEVKIILNDFVSATTAEARATVAEEGEAQADANTSQETARSSLSTVQSWWASHHQVANYLDGLQICHIGRSSTASTPGSELPPFQMRPRKSHRGAEAEQQDNNRLSDLTGSDAPPPSVHSNSLSSQSPHLGAGESKGEGFSLPLDDHASLVTVASGSTESAQPVPRLLPVAPTGAVGTATGLPPRKASTAGNLLRSISGTFRSGSSIGHGPDIDALPPPPTSSASHSPKFTINQPIAEATSQLAPAVPAKDRDREVSASLLGRTRTTHAAPMLPTLDLGSGDLSPEVSTVDLAGRRTHSNTETGTPV